LRAERFLARQAVTGLELLLHDVPANPQLDFLVEHRATFD
jgi:hypothetical protein